ncbi:hypothetical protein Holit_01721 [Hollandina sp. SP2]
MKKNSVLFFTLALAALMLAGCPNDSGETVTPPSAPDTPAGVTVTPAESQLSVAWNAVEGADTYEVKWGSDAAATKTGITGTSHLITGLTNGTKYDVQVRAKNAVGTSEWSAAVSGTPAAATAAPETPAKPTVTASGDTLTVTWTGVTGATKYQVFYGSSANPTTQYGSDVTGTSVTFAVTSNGTWYVRIKAGNSIGYSEYSPDATVTVSGVQSVIGSWKYDNETYTFGENGKLIRVRTYNDESPDTSYYFYDPAKKEVYRATPGSYTLTDDTLSISFFGQLAESWTSTDHNGIIGTWTRTGETMKITADEITIGSNTYPYYTYSEGSSTGLAYRNSNEPYGRYALSGGKLQFTRINRTTYTREGSGSDIVGTWKYTWNNEEESETWTFNSNGTMKYESSDRTLNYTSYTVSGDKISLEQEVATLSGSTLTFSGLPFTRKGSGSDVIGTWEFSQEGVTITLTITSNKVEMTQTYKGETQSDSWPVRISGNSIYYTEERGYKLEGSSLTIIEEYTDEYAPVSP